MRKIPFNEYVQIKAVNMSTLLELLLSPKHYRHRVQHPPRETTAMRVGRAAHTAVLEPFQFMREYVLQPDTFPDAKGNPKPATKQLKSCKEWWQAQESTGKTVLTSEEYARAERIQNAVRSHKVAARILAEGQSEQTVEWTDPETGLRCKGRVDWLAHISVADLKTTRHVSPYAFAKQAGTLNYHTRLAWYQDGVLAATGASAAFRRPVHIIAVQNEEPHDVAVYRVPDEALDVGRKRYRGLLEMLKECIASDYWPGIAEEEELQLQLPAWMLGADTDEGETITIGGQPLTI